jgi:uncharacterized protein
MSPFLPRFEALPPALPIFPLTGALLLPRGQLPLNIFEPRYLALTRDALGTADRFIGMVQPLDNKGDAGDPPVYRTACAGRITEFTETEDGRYLITLTGLLRFDIKEELPREDFLYRRAVPDWQRWRDDLAPRHEQIARERFLAALKPFFERHQIEADWQALASADDERLVTAIAMVAPFAPSEKQALLEAPDTAERANLLTALLEMSAKGGDVPDVRARH